MLATASASQEDRIMGAAAQLVAELNMLLQVLEAERDAIEVQTEAFMRQSEECPNVLTEAVAKLGLNSITCMVVRTILGRAIEFAAWLGEYVAGVGHKAVMSRRMSNIAFFAHFVPGVRPFSLHHPCDGRLLAIIASAVLAAANYN